MKQVSTAIREARNVLLDSRHDVTLVLPWVQLISDAMRKLKIDAPAPPEPIDETSGLAWLKQVEHAWLREQSRRGHFSPRLKRGLAVLAWVAVIGPALAYSLRSPEMGRGPWRAAYYGDPHFETTPIIRRHMKVRDTWDRMPPIPELPPDKFGIRYDTCLELSESQTVLFQLGSDDGSRLLVDGEVVIDQFENTRYHRESSEIELEAGIHHIHIDYVEIDRSARIAFAASLSGERPTDLPLELLGYPGNDLDATNPCAPSD